MKEKLNVIYSSDDNYARHMGVSIKSLLETNKEFSEIEIFIIENEITAANKEKLAELVHPYPNARITWINFAGWKKELRLNMAWKISISSYARLFIAEMVRTEIEKILYLDCDMIICKSLHNLWNEDIGNVVLAAVQDPVGDHIKAAVGMAADDRYFNAGMLLINLKQWRTQNIGEKCLTFIKNKEGNVTHHDQGTLNGVLNGQVKFLHPQYNVMTILYILSREQQNQFFGNHADYYRESELREAKELPVILHYTPSFTTRPWVKNCKHPLRKKYWDVLMRTPWKGYQLERDSRKIHVRAVEWWHRKKSRWGR